MSSDVFDADAETLIQRGVGLVDDGLATVDELTLPERVAEADDVRVELTADELRDAVRERLDGDGEDAAEGDEADDDADGDGEAQVVDTADIDWPALWREFGFDTPDAAGNQWVSRTALALAVSVSEQGIHGDAEGHVTTAADRGTLVTVTATTDHGAETVRGYRCPEVER